ncbi:hypothetical protein H6764_01170 [Candidatus Nomurabacteria bacterium]|nr:hypothetical protein [Candidatus Nomurabacteria bacterium]
MFGLNKLTNYLLTIALAVALGVSLTLTSLFYSAKEILTDKENAKRWIKETSLREEFVNVLTEQVYSEKPAEILEPIVSKSDFKKIANQEANKEWVDQAIDTTVDNTYDWLEGKSEAPEIVIPVKKDQKNGLPSLETLVTDKIGKPASIIDFDKVSEISPAIKLLNTDKITIINISDAYAKLKKLPQQMAIVSLVIAAALLVSGSSLRQGILMVGFGLVTSAGLLLFGPTYLKDHPEVTKNVLSLDLSRLPKLVDLPPIIRDLFGFAFNEVYKSTKAYAIVAGAIGVIAGVISQLSIKSVELEAEKKPSKDFF